MALPLWVFAALEKLDLQQSGNFTIPYTVVIDNGCITTAYHCGASEGGGTTGGRGHGAGKPASCIFRHVYDCSPQTVLQGLTIADEAFEMSQHGTARASEVTSMFVERVPPQESLRSRREKRSLLSVEYLTAQQSLNLLQRGASHLYPQSYADTELSLKEHLMTTRQEPVALEPRKRSGMMQRFEALHGSGHTCAVLLKWRRHQATTIIVPANDDERKRVSLSLECRENRTPVHDPLAFPYQRCVTVDGIHYMSDPVDPIPSHVTDGVLRAAAVILRLMNGEAQSVVSAVLMFRVSLAPAAVGSSSSPIQFLYAPFVQMKSDILLHPPLGFAVPAQYRFKQGGRPRPRSVHIYEEDLIQDPVMDFTRAEPVAPESPPTPNPIADGRHKLLEKGGANLQDCVERVLQPHSEQRRASQSAALLDWTTDELYEHLERNVLAEGRSVEGVDELDGGRRPKGRGRKGTPSECITPARTLTRAERDVIEARRHQQDVERASKLVVRMLNDEMPVNMDVLRALTLTKKQTRSLEKLAAKQQRARHANGGGGALLSAASATHGNAPPFVIDGAAHASALKAMQDPDQRARSRAGSSHPSVRGNISPLKRRSTPSFLLHATTLNSSLDVHRVVPSPSAKRREDSPSPSADDGSAPLGASHSTAGALAGEGSGTFASPRSARSGISTDGTGQPPPSPLPVVLGITPSEGRTLIAPYRRPVLCTNVDEGESSGALLSRNSSSLGAASTRSPAMADGVQPSCRNSGHPVPSATASIDAYLDSVDAACAAFHMRTPTTYERLQYLLSHASEATLHTHRAQGKNVARCIAMDRVVQAAVLAAAEYVEALWYHIDGQALSVGSVATAAATARLRSGDVTRVDHMSAIFSLSLAYDTLLLTRDRCSGAPKPDETVLLSGAETAAHPVQQPTWAAEEAVMAVAEHAPQGAPDDPVEEASHRRNSDDGGLQGAAAPTDSGDGSPGVKQETTADIPTAEATPSAECAPAPIDVDASLHDVQPLTTSAEHTTPDADDDGSIRSTLERLDILQTVQNAIHGFLCSMPTVKVLFHPAGELLGGLHHEGYAALLQEALSECNPLPSPFIQHLVVPEERYAAWSQGGVTLAMLRERKWCVYGIALGAAPPLADAEQRAARWICGPLRHLYVSLLTTLHDAMQL